MNPHSKLARGAGQARIRVWHRFVTEPKHEVPVHRILPGAKPDDAANRNAMANPDALDAFAEYASTQRDYRLG
jgi:hypothetical protein